MKKFNQIVAYFPAIGMSVYLIMFTAAASMYPGGSENIQTATDGYSFFHNFLCDTNNEFTHSGLKNNGKVLANLAHIVLSLTMMSFFYVMPNIFNHSNRNTKLIKILGVLAMAIFTFMYQEELHDLVVTLVGVFASMAFLPIFIELVKYKNRPFKILTYIVFIMSLTLYLGFETKVGIYYMPFLQKFVFMVDATLVYWTAIIVIRKNNRGLEA
ncbi:MAG: hypothetical protein P8N07_02460 [Flavobacteriales bacterium]|nr:hypothetical protein [Flavobacteriales bacterium]